MKPSETSKVTGLKNSARVKKLLELIKPNSKRSVFTWVMIALAVLASLYDMYATGGDNFQFILMVLFNVAGV